MADPKALEILKQGVQLWNNNWNSLNRDLSKADLHGQDLTGARFEATNLADANFRGSTLCSAHFEGADLSSAHLEGANLSSAVFGKDDRGANLCNAQLREAILRGCNLSSVKGNLQQRQLAGADLTGATLPAPLTKLFDDLEAVEDISESARKLFLAMLVGCLYSWLAVGTTTDVNLITNRASLPLPIIQTSIPIVGFYVVAPLLLLCVYFYFHFYLQKLWEELGSLPAIFPDGRRLHERSDPWLLNDLVRSHVRLLRDGRPFMSYFQQAISIVMAWWLVPVTLFLFWGRFLSHHDLYWTTLQVELLALSITAAVFLYRLAAATLRGVERQPFSRRGALRNFRGYSAVVTFLATGAAFMVVSVGAIGGFRPGGQAWWSGRTTGPWSWIPRAMVVAHHSRFLAPFFSPAEADLKFAEVSTKPPNWTGKSESEVDLVKGADLTETNLQYADAYGAFLAKASLSGAHLEGADLRSSDLRQAYAEIEAAHLIGADLTGAHLNEAHLPHSDLTNVDLTGADLSGADLRWARLPHAILTGAILDGADLTFADFRSPDSVFRTTGLTTIALKRAENWDKAYYDDDLLQQLGLPPDHNQKLEEEQKPEEQKQG